MSVKELKDYAERVLRSFVHGSTGQKGKAPGTRMSGTGISIPFGARIPLLVSDRTKVKGTNRLHDDDDDTRPGNRSPYMLDSDVLTDWLGQGRLEGKPLFVIAPYGSGKSMMISAFAGAMATYILKNADDSTIPVPWPVRLRDAATYFAANPNAEWLQFMFAAQDSLDPDDTRGKLSYETFRRLIEAGRLVPFFDGFDEVGTQYEHRKYYLSRIQSVCHSTSYVITSRPGYDLETEASQAVVFDIQELSTNQCRRFLRESLSDEPRLAKKALVAVRKVKSAIGLSLRRPLLLAAWRKAFLADPDHPLDTLQGLMEELYAHCFDDRRDTIRLFRSRRNELSDPLGAVLLSLAMSGFNQPMSLTSLDPMLRPFNRQLSNGAESTVALGIDLGLIVRVGESRFAAQKIPVVEYLVGRYLARLWMGDADQLSLAVQLFRKCVWHHELRESFDFMMEILARTNRTRALELSQWLVGVALSDPWLADKNDQTAQDDFVTSFLYLPCRWAQFIRFGEDELSIIASHMIPAGRCVDHLMTILPIVLPPSLPSSFLKTMLEAAVSIAVAASDEKTREAELELLEAISKHTDQDEAIALVNYAALHINVSVPEDIQDAWRGAIKAMAGRIPSEFAPRMTMIWLGKAVTLADEATASAWASAAKASAARIDSTIVSDWLKNMLFLQSRPSSRSKDTLVAEYFWVEVIRAASGRLKSDDAVDLINRHLDRITALPEKSPDRWYGSTLLITAAECVVGQGCIRMMDLVLALENRRRDMRLAARMAEHLIRGFPAGNHKQLVNNLLGISSEDEKNREYFFKAAQKLIRKWTVTPSDEMANVFYQSALKAGVETCEGSNWIDMAIRLSGQASGLTALQSLCTLLKMSGDRRLTEEQRSSATRAYFKVSAAQTSGMTLDHIGLAFDHAITQNESILRDWISTIRRRHLEAVSKDQRDATLVLYFMQVHDRLEQQPNVQVEIRELIRRVLHRIPIDNPSQLKAEIIARFNNAPPSLKEDWWHILSAIPVEGDNRTEKNQFLADHLNDILLGREDVVSGTGSEEDEAIGHDDQWRIDDVQTALDQGRLDTALDDALRNDVVILNTTPPSGSDRPSHMTFKLCLRTDPSLLLDLGLAPPAIQRPVNTVPSILNDQTRGNDSEDIEVDKSPSLIAQDQRSDDKVCSAIANHASPPTSAMGVAGKMGESNVSASPRGGALVELPSSPASVPMPADSKDNGKLPYLIPLSSRERFILIAMLQLNAINSDNRQLAREIAVKAIGRTAAADSIRREMSRLKKEGFVDTIPSRDGGSFLTLAGFERARKLQDDFEGPAH